MAQQQQTLAEQFIEALHALEQGQEGALERMVGMFSGDARLTNAALKQSGREHSGQDGARTFWAAYRDTFGEVRSEFFQVTSNDQSAGLFWTTRGTDRAGAPLEYDGVSLLVFDDAGKISLFRGYYDTRDLTRSVVAE